MSQAAEASVQACRHPKVKGATRALLEAIARAIPEGQTFTGPMTLPELAAEAQCVEKTARRCRDTLQRAGLIHIHDGGQGNVARFEILGVTGDRPITTAPVPSARTAPSPAAL